MKRTIKISILLLLLLTMCVGVSAQSADKLYQEGITLLAQAKKSQNKQTALTARNKFSAAKVLNTSVTNVRRCDGGIAECNKIINKKEPLDPQKCYQQGMAFLSQANKEKDKRPARAKTAAQNAKRQFELSKTLNQSSKNVEQCDRMIAECMTFLEEAPNAFTLSLSEKRLEFAAHTTETKMVTVTTSSDADWTYDLAIDSEWLSVTRSYAMDSVLDIRCYSTDETLERYAAIYVRYKGLCDTILVCQKGTDVELKVKGVTVDGTNEYGTEKVKEADGSVGYKLKPIEISKFIGAETVLLTFECNSSARGEDGRNWQLVSLPAWVHRNDMVKEHKKEKVKVSNLKRAATGALETTTTERPCTSEELSLSVDKIEENSDDFLSGRIGDVVIRSQDKEITVKIMQTGKRKK